MNGYYVMLGHRRNLEGPVDPPKRGRKGKESYLYFIDKEAKGVSVTDDNGNDDLDNNHDGHNDEDSTESADTGLTGPSETQLTGAATTAVINTGYVNCTELGVITVYATFFSFFLLVLPVLLLLAFFGIFLPDITIFTRMAHKITIIQY